MLENLKTVSFANGASVGLRTCFVLGQGSMIFKLKNSRKDIDYCLASFSVGSLLSIRGYLPVNTIDIRLPKNKFEIKWIFSILIKRNKLYYLDDKCK